MGNLVVAPNVNSCHEYSPDVASSTSESPCALVVDIGNEIDVFQGSTMFRIVLG